MSADYFTFRGPWFTAKEAAAYVCCKSVRSYYEWRKAHGIVTRLNGTVAKADLDRELKKKRTRRYGGSVRHPNSLANLGRSPKRMAHVAPQPDEEKTA